MEAGPPLVERHEKVPYELPSRRRARTTAMVMLSLIVALFAVGAGKRVWDATRRSRTRVEWGMDEATFERITEALERGMLSPRDVAFQGYVDRQMEAALGRGEKVRRDQLEETLAQKVFMRGVPRLTDADLTTLHALRKRMAFASDRTCPCMMDAPRCTMAEVMDGFRHLSNEELSRWGLLVSRASSLEVQALAPLPSAVPQFQEELGKIRAALDRQTNDRLQRVFDNPGQASKTDVCFVVRTVFTGAEKLDEAAYVRFVRAMMVVIAP